MRACFIGGHHPPSLRGGEDAHVFPSAHCNLLKKKKRGKGGGKKKKIPGTRRTCPAQWMFAPHNTAQKGKGKSFSGKEKKRGQEEILPKNQLVLANMESQPLREERALSKKNMLRKKKKKKKKNHPAERGGKGKIGQKLRGGL